MNLARLFRQRHAPRCGIPPQPIDDTALAAVRWVVVDLETTGLDIYRDEILSIGAVTVAEGALSMAGQFECTVYQPDHRPGEATLLHEIAPSQVRTGQPLGQALQDFMDYAGSCVMVAYHAGFERRMLDRGLRREWAQRLQHPFIDLAELAPMLHPDCQDRCHTLDDWQQHFHLTNSERHNAAADAMVSAELLLIMLNRLAREGTNTLAELDNRLARWRRLHRLRAVRL
jgi:DNA polymerase-3 subunit epsilon